MSKRYKLRETIPNPQGGAYADPTPELLDRNADISIAEIRHVMKKLIALQLEANAGNTRACCQGLGALFVSALAEFMQNNRAEGQDASIEAYDEAVSCLAAMGDKLQGIALLKALGFPDDAAARIHVVHL